MSRALDVEKVEQLATQRLLLAPLSFSLSLLIPLFPSFSSTSLLLSAFAAVANSRGSDKHFPGQLWLPKSSAACFACPALPCCLPALPACSTLRSCLHGILAKKVHTLSLPISLPLSLSHLQLQASLVLKVLRCLHSNYV